VARLGIEAAEALEHAHQMGIVHRDIKPANLVVDVAGRLWVTDFGLAQMQNDTRLTMTGDRLGTVRYMSPEQALAKHGLVDHRTDIYALEVTLCELLILRPAVSGKDGQEVLNRLAFGEPEAPRNVDRSIPAELDKIVLKAMERDPASRYATAQELANDLRRFLKNEPVRARRPSLAQRAAKWGQRNRALVAASVSVLALATVLLAISTVLIWAEKNNTESALEQARQPEKLARANEAKAEASRQRAETNFRKGLNAMTELVRKVTAAPAGTPETAAIHKRLEAEALSVIRSFIDETGQDPPTRHETAGAYLSLGILHIYPVERIVGTILHLGLKVGHRLGVREPGRGMFALARPRSRLPVWRPATPGNDC
jgi:hypothetical protein